MVDNVAQNVDMIQHRVLLFFILHCYLDSNMLPDLDSVRPYTYPYRQLFGPRLLFILIMRLIDRIFFAGKALMVDGTTCDVSNRLVLVAFN